MAVLARLRCGARRASEGPERAVQVGAGESQPTKCSALPRDRSEPMADIELAGATAALCEVRRSISLSKQ